jgi:hypothetical protein
VSLYLAAALLPLVASVASLATAVDGSAWADVTPSLLRAVTPDALLYSAVGVVVAAPLAGVAVASFRRRPGVERRRQPALRTVGQLALATAIFSVVSALLTIARLGLDAEAIRFAITSHAVLASVTVALAAFGAWLGSLFRDPLDAAALAVTATLTAAYGVLVAGAPVGELSAPILKAALLASPLMTVATAAQVDLVRTDIWYQISPLAHVRLEYPSWGMMCGAYLAAGCAGFFATMWCRAGRGPERRQRL